MKTDIKSLLSEADEARRLSALHAYKILDSGAEQSFDDLSLFASSICQTPIALVTFVGSDRQWFKSKVGIDGDGTPRNVSFCDHAIRHRAVFVVPDATKDERFSSNPLVTGTPEIRFYAGAPLVTPGGEGLGTICVIDRKPRELRPDQADGLTALARHVVSLLELRRIAAENAKLCTRIERNAKRRIRQVKASERLKREQRHLREAVAGMEQVLGVVGHELRTPLASIRAVSEFLVSDGARAMPEFDQFLRDIGSEVDRMSDTVNNLLEAARLDSGHTRWNWSEFDLVEVAREAVASVRPLIDNDRIAIAMRFDHVAIPMRGDRDGIRRLILNLLTNAAKHTLAGAIGVDARLVDSDVGPWLELKVFDTGCGIDANVAARLGEAFALNSGVVGRNHVSGAGLGLAICKGIAAAHGGALSFASAVGKGTTVTARLRADLARPHETRPARADRTERAA